MRAYVYTAKALQRYAGQFVWLSINTEESRNSDFLARYPITALPTLLVLDPTGRKILLRYVGGATVPELTKILEEASKKGTTNSDQLLASADKLASDGKHAQAVAMYEAALKDAPAKWSRYRRTAESLIYSLSLLNDNERCAARALELCPPLAGTTSGANVAATGLGCAVEMKEGDSHRGQLLLSLEKYAREALNNPKIDLSDDDRSGLYAVLIEAREAAKDKEAATRLKQDWSAFLERAAAEAKTPEQRAVYDSHRLSAYIDLGTPEKAISMLKQSEKDFPDDYNPPARLAVAYNTMKNYDEALAASDRALAKSYGPRKIQILATRADIYQAKADREKACDTIAAAIAYARQLPKGQQNERTLAALEKKFAELSR